MPALGRADRNTSLWHADERRSQPPLRFCGERRWAQLTSEPNGTTTQGAARVRQTRLGLALLLSFVGAFFAGRPNAQALVTAPVGGRPGDVDVNLRVTLERGTSEPNDNRASWHNARWEMYTIGAGYNVGDVGVFQRLFFRLELTHYNSPEERPNGPITGLCPGPVTNGSCAIHGADQGQLITPQAGFDVIHETNYSFGVYGQITIPLGVDWDKFALPRTDLFAAGTRVGVRLNRWLSYSSTTLFGTGPANGRQNATVALINLFTVERNGWLPGQKFGISVGPYFDADLTERFDTRYDAAFISGVPTDLSSGQVTAATTRDRIRMMRFGAIVAPYMAVNSWLAFEANYTQKIFGYDTPATRFMSLGARIAY